MIAPGDRPVRWLVGLTAGLCLWASSFVALYAGLALGCEAGWHQRQWPGTNLLTWTLAAVWSAHLVALVMLWRWIGRWPQTGSLRPLARPLALVALVATVWTGWPVLALPPCAGQVLAHASSEERTCSTT